MLLPLSSSMVNGEAVNNTSGGGSGSGSGSGGGGGGGGGMPVFNGGGR